MASTPYSSINAQFSQDAHEQARVLIYPRAFGVMPQQLAFEDVTGTDLRSRALDGELGIDRVIKVTVEHLYKPIEFTIQERFRRIDKLRWRDITITEWNMSSDTPSELYKIKADYFIYGYYDDTDRRFVGESLMVNVAAFKKMITAPEWKQLIERGRNENPRSKQIFVGFEFDRLMTANVVDWYINWTEVTGKPARRILTLYDPDEYGQSSLLPA
jgi:hypothetical protein